MWLRKHCLMPPPHYTVRGAAGGDRKGCKLTQRSLNVSTQQACTSTAELRPLLRLDHSERPPRERRAGPRRASNREQGTATAEDPSGKPPTCCWFHLRSGMRTKPSEGSGFSNTIRSASAFLSRMLYTHWKERDRGGSDLVTVAWGDSPDQARAAPWLLQEEQPLTSGDLRSGGPVPRTCSHGSRRDLPSYHC